MYLSHRSIGPALAFGNGVVVKPAEDTPVTGGLLIAKIYEEAGLPPGLLNIVIGEVKEIGDAIHFASGTAPHIIYGLHESRQAHRTTRHERSQMKRVALELGGNAPCVILDDADVEYAVRATADRQISASGPDLHEHKSHHRRCQGI